MGERGYVVVKQEHGDVSFYTHWTGYKMKTEVAKALDFGRSRWDDEGYLSKIIFCQMAKDSLDRITGFGIYAGHGDKIGLDYNYPSVIVDCKNKTVNGIEFAQFVSEHKDKTED